MSANQMLRAEDGTKWMEKRNMNNSKSNRNHIEFAKNLFLSWNDDGSGKIQADEILKPLTAMGLSTDTKFI